MFLIVGGTNPTAFGGFAGSGGLMDPLFEPNDAKPGGGDAGLATADGLGLIGAGGGLGVKALFRLGLA